jgi:serine/threonine-protein kinase RsbW
MFRYVIQIRNDYTDLANAIREISLQLKQQGMAAEFISTVNLGLEEVITNVLKHAYDDQNEHRIDIELIWSGDEFQMEINDDGQEFNPLTQPEPIATQPLEERQPGGWGIPLVRRLFDSVTYERKTNRNLLVLRKRIDADMSAQ